MDTHKSYQLKVVIAFTLSFLWLLFLVTPASAQNSEPYRIEEFNMNGPGNLEVRTSGGHITVEASETNQVRIEMYASKNGKALLPSDTDLDEFEIEISSSGNKVIATARKKKSNDWKFWHNNNTSISFVIYTPREISSNLKTSGGHIKTLGLHGNQEISTSGGHLELAELRGDVNARTSGGHINIQDFEGEMDARTSGGHIEVNNARGNINVRTSGGHIELAGVGGSMEASTSGGNISANLEEIGRFVNLRTSGGNVSISVPEGIGLDLNLRGSHIRTDLKNFSGSLERDEVEGQINGGGPQIAARTSGGVISISFR